MTHWEEIDGFSSPGEFERFEKYLERQVTAGRAREIEVDQAYGPGEIYGGRWYEETASGERWRLVPPDPPFRGVWERIPSRPGRGAGR